MNRSALLFLSVALIVATTVTHAQTTPQAIIANTPNLPTPEQCLANDHHVEAFTTKIAELNDALARIQSADIPTISTDELVAAKTKQERENARKHQQMQRDAERGMQEAAAMGFTEADLQRMMTMSEKDMEAFVAQKMAASPQAQAMKAMGFTDADMQKMQNMSEKQGEAYMKKRMAELGISEDEFRQRMTASGAIMLSEEEMEAERQREREAEAQGSAIKRAQETQQEYLDQMELKNAKIAESESNAIARIKALWKSSKPAIDAAQAYLAELGGPEEIMRGTITQDQYEVRASRVKALYDAYYIEAYRIWQDNILATQGYLKSMMPYAQAADEARRTQAQVMNRDNETMAQLQGMTNYAVTIAGLYLNATESVLTLPKIEQN
ncbi:MAG: hypothetical protein LBM67_06415 [Lentimicrobiaceae bacterium]|nr:hypothetical protein [Lentimicrobiaceae bacterium]